MELDRTDPVGAIRAAVERCSNWGRWGADDVLGTANFIDDAKRREGAALVRRGAPSRCPSVRVGRPAEGLAPPDQPGAHHARHRAGCRARTRASRTVSGAQTM